MATNNAIQKVIDLAVGGLVLLIVLVGAAVAFGRSPLSGHLLPSSHSMGAVLPAAMCPVTAVRPSWTRLQAMLEAQSYKDVPLLFVGNLRD